MKEITRSVIFTDIVGFSKLRKEVGDSRSFQILEHHDRILFDSIKMYRGEVVKTVGDSIMAVFESPVNSAKCAVSIQHGLHRYNSKVVSAQEQIPGVRMGMSYGVMDEMERFGQVDYLGGIVDKAFRVQSVADGGHIFITETDLHIIENRMATQTIAFHTHGQSELRSIGLTTLVEILYKLPGSSEFIVPQQNINIDSEAQLEKDRNELMQLLHSCRLPGTNPTAIQDYKNTLPQKGVLNNFSQYIQLFSDKERNWITKPDELQALGEIGIEHFQHPEEWAAILETFGKAAYRSGLRQEPERILKKALQFQPNAQLRVSISDTLKKLQLAAQTNRLRQNNR